MGNKRLQMEHPLKPMTSEELRTLVNSLCDTIERLQAENQALRVEVARSRNPSSIVPVRFP